MIKLTKINKNWDIIKHPERSNKFEQN